jgi:hypothetical protein
MFILKIDYAPLYMVKALKSVIEDNRYYSYEVSMDHYGRHDISVECGSYEDFRRLVSAMDENRT